MNASGSGRARPAPRGGSGNVSDPHLSQTEEALQREIAQRLTRLNGPGELRAALLAMVRTRGSARELQAWREHTQGLANAEAVRADIGALAPDARLPWFEVLVDRLKDHPAGDRRGLVEAARNVMAADGKVRPRDRLLWLALRHRLGEAPADPLSGSSGNDFSNLDDATTLAIATFTAFLARLVPEASDEVAIGVAGQQWYAAALVACLPEERRPALAPPDGDAMLRALRLVQGLSWMLRPVLVRAWVDAAFARSTPPARDASDALRLACRLLESPMPPALVGQYIEPAIHG